MSERTLDSDLRTGAVSGVFGYVIFVALDFPSGILYVHNGQGTYTYGGNDYVGVGAYGNISVLNESVAIVDNPVTLTLSSITTEIVEAIRNDNIYGRDATISVGRINDDMELLGTPTVWIDGYMEKKELSIGETDAVSITVQDDSAKLNQRNNKRLTLEDHQAEHSGDLFLEFLPYVQNAEVEWGGQRVRTGFQNTGGFTQTETPDRRGRGGGKK